VPGEASETMVYCVCGHIVLLRKLAILRCKLYAEVFLSGFQMGYGLGLGGCWPAGYYLVYSKIVIYVPMYSTCLPTYLCAYLPIMYDSLFIDC
jgi:hypothetical protein